MFFSKTLAKSRSTTQGEIKPIRHKAVRLLTSMALLFLPALGIAYWLTGKEPLYYLLPARPKLIGEMIMSAPGNANPLLVRAADANLQPNEIVIGVALMGEARAYRRGALSGAPANHVVHDRFGTLPVTVTHCDRTRMTRVFTSRTEESHLDVRCGGWMIQQEMALLVNGRRVAHSARDIPLEDVAFVTTTWEEWKAAHPDTVIYLGRQLPLQ